MMKTRHLPEQEKVDEYNAERWRTLENACCVVDQQCLMMMMMTMTDDEGRGEEIRDLVQKKEND